MSSTVFFFHCSPFGLMRGGNRKPQKLELGSKKFDEISTKLHLFVRKHGIKPFLLSSDSHRPLIFHLTPIGPSSFI